MVQLSSSDGVPNGSGVHPIEVFDDGSIKINSVTVNTPASASVVLSAGAATDEMDITITALPARVHMLEVWITDSISALTLTGTAASGALTAVDGGILSVHTAKKHITCVTPITGIINLSLVDSANTAGEVVCVRMPDGTIVKSDASVSGSYQGG